MPPLRVLTWHVHGSYLAALAEVPVTWYLPVLPGRPQPYGGRGASFDWPDNVVEVPAEDVARLDLDCVVHQSRATWEDDRFTLLSAAQRRLPTVYLEHDPPREAPTDTPHPVDDPEVLVVHVTAFNRLMWDNGRAPTTVIDHGIADPGHLYTGDIAAAGAMINEPVRRWRTVGADLLGAFGQSAPVDVWGIGTEELNDPAHRCAGVTGHGDLRTAPLMKELAHRRVYLHTARWTSLGLSLLEAMFLGMPVVAVASTMAPLVVPPEAGVVSADVDTLRTALRGLVADRYLAEVVGKAARDHARDHFGLERFLREWDRVIDAQCTAGP